MAGPASREAGGDCSPLVTGGHLTVTYEARGRRAHQALSDVSFELYPNEILGVVGESGAGKSTLGKIVAGFVTPTSGTLSVADQAGVLHQRSIRSGHGFRDIQMVFQESTMALNPRMRVVNAVMEALPNARSREEARERALSILMRVGLGPAYAKRRPAQLSGGERQRAAIARALAAEAAVLVCDEAVASLDVSIKAALLNLILSLRDESQLTLLFISHDISVMAYLADRLLVMNAGQIVESGPTRDVIDMPQHPYTRQLIAAVPSMERRTCSG
jgi:ABC-type glutathione transport system ATPase component